jgi:hypothetical protein
MINDMLMNKLNPEDKHAIIAYELAHVYLKHGYDTPFNEKTKKDIEQEADDLIRSWGFNPNIDISHLRLESRRWLTEPRSANGMTNDDERLANKKKEKEKKNS